MRSIKLLIIALCILHTATGQIIEKSKDYYLLQSSDTIFISTFKIKNNTSDDLFVWFDSSNIQAITNYFSALKGDFSLLSLLNEETVENKRFDLINLTFVKKIRSKNFFAVTVLYKDRVSWQIDKFEKDIKAVKAVKLRGPILAALNRNEKRLFQADFISFTK